MTTAMFRALVIEDDDELRAMLRALLESQSFRVSEAANGRRGLIEARSHRPDLAVVDLGLPDMDGVEVIQEIRSFSQIPIIVLTARTNESEKIRALDSGADDYVTKPFSATELLARVRAALRRVIRVGVAPARMKLGDIQLDVNGRTATGPDGPIHLTPLEYRLIECLARSAGMIVTQKQLLREVWGPGRESDVRGLRSYVRFLRQKLEAEPSRPRFIITEAGVGFKLAENRIALQQCELMIDWCAGVLDTGAPG
jgi:two-component system, OmpR family, KDP operon response regulator KdpE